MHTSLTDERMIRDAVNKGDKSHGHLSPRRRVDFSDARLIMLHTSTQRNAVAASHRVAVVLVRAEQFLGRIPEDSVRKPIGYSVFLSPAIPVLPFADASCGCGFSPESRLFATAAARATDAGQIPSPLRRSSWKICGWYLISRGSRAFRMRTRSIRAVLRDT